MVDDFHAKLEVVKTELVLEKWKVIHLQLI